MWVDEGERSVTTCWDNADDVIQMFYMHIHDLFGQPLTTLAYISGDNAHVDLLDAIFNNQRNIENGSIGGFFALPENDVTCVMEYFQNARNLNLCFTLFGYDLSKYKFHHIFIDDGEELSYQKLMELDYVALDLYQRRDSDNSLQNEQLNSLLRLWLTGFLPRMKNFRLETTTPLMLTNILEKIDFELSERQLEADGDTIKTEGPFHIRRLTDGKIAMVYTMDFWNYDEQWMTVFEFSVYE
ncbi:unnamed protein product [Caenorhabditis brenneri]